MTVRRRLRGAATRHLRRLREDRFLRRLALLSSGVVLGQAVTVLVSPLLSRLYTPAEFGVLGVVMAMTAMIGGVVAWRYELAVPICDQDEDAAALCVLALLAGLATVVLLALGAWRLGPAIAALLGLPELLPVLWLVPVAILGWGMALPLTSWSIRRGTFRVNALGRALQLIVQAASQTALGLAAVGGLGLVLGHALGHLTRLGLFLVRLPLSDWALLAAVRRRRLWQAARTQWRYPAFSTPSMLLQSGTQYLPALLMAAFYGPAAAGWFAFGQRLLEMPVVLLSMNASAVYLGEVRGLDAHGLRRLFLRTALRFLALGLAGMLPLLLLGPPLFALVFGESWRMAGTMVQYLVPVQLARFVVLPIAQTLNLFARQDLHLLSAGLNLVALVAAFGSGFWLALGMLPTLGLYSLGSSLAYLLYFLLAWRIVRQASRGGLAPTAR